MDAFKDPYGILSLMAAKKIIEDDDNEEDFFNPPEFISSLDKVINSADNRALGKKDKRKIESHC